MLLIPVCHGDDSGRIVYVIQISVRVLWIWWKYALKHSLLDMITKANTVYNEGTTEPVDILRAKVAMIPVKIRIGTANVD